VNGIFYPEGTEICVCPMGVGRRKDIFGEDADIFRPDRWTEADAAARNKYERATEVIFGSGRFTCLGKNIAMIELHKVFVEVRKLRWKTVYKKRINGANANVGSFSKISTGPSQIH
jgi:cytochrome P450